MKSDTCKYCVLQAVEDAAGSVAMDFITVIWFPHGQFRECIYFKALLFWRAAFCRVYKKVKLHCLLALITATSLNPEHFVLVMPHMGFFNHLP